MFGKEIAEDDAVKEYKSMGIDETETIPVQGIISEAVRLGI